MFRSIICARELRKCQEFGQRFWETVVSLSLSLRRLFVLFYTTGRRVHTSPQRHEYEIKLFPVLRLTRPGCHFIYALRAPVERRH